MPVHPLSVARFVIAAGVGIPVVVEDLRHRRISNKSCGILFSAGIALALLDDGLTGAGTALGGALLGFCLFIVPYLAKGMGAGDVKLMAGCGSLLGFRDVLTASVLTAVAGAVVACAALIYGAILQKRRSSIPYAPAIMLGAGLMLLSRLR